MRFVDCSKQSIVGALVALALGIGGTATGQSPQPVTTFDSTPPSGKYAFASWTPKTMVELMKGNASGEATNIFGHLFLPPGEGKVPAVVLVHGSGGIYNAELDYWPKAFNAAGFAVFTLDMFGPRGVQSTAEDQSQVPFAADVADAFAALKLLATHPRIDAKHIAAMGFSRGGTAVMRADIEKVVASQKLPDGLRYAAIIPTYSGACAGLFRLVVKPTTFTKSPILFLHGDADDYTPIAPCQDYADKIGKAGVPVEFVVLEGAQHKFDADDLKRYYLRAATKTKPDCPLETDFDTGFVYDKTNGNRLQGEALAATQKSCTTTGANVEGSHRARDKAAQAAIAFLQRTLAN